MYVHVNEYNQGKHDKMQITTVRNGGVTERGRERETERKRAAREELTGLFKILLTLHNHLNGINTCKDTS